MTTTDTPAPTTPDHTPTTARRRVELGTYTTDTHHDRRLIGQPIDGIVHLCDEPIDGDAPRYLIEQGLTANTELQGTDRVERFVAVLLELSLDEAGSASAAARDVRDPDAFC